MATWAKGLDFKNSTNTTVLGGVGLYGNDTVAEKVYLGIGADPWNNKGLELTANSIRFKGTDLSLNGHTHSYLPLSGGNLTGGLTFPSTAAVSATNQPIQIGYNGGAMFSSYSNVKIFANTDATSGDTEYVHIAAARGIAPTTAQGMIIANTYARFNGQNLVLNDDSRLTDSRPANGGNASTATTLQTARTINGTSFNGSANITTANWGTARNLTIGNTAKSVNGSANVSWSLSEIGAASSSHSHNYLSQKWTTNISANTWSRILHVPGVKLASGGIITISGTRNAVVYSNTFIFNGAHPGRGNITQISAGKYSELSARLVVDSNGNTYVELLDTADQELDVVFVQTAGHLSITKYTSSTSGASIPSGFTATTTMKLNNDGINAEEIKVNNQTVYHTGRRPSASDIGAASSSHTHSTLTRGSYLTGSNYNGGSAQTWAVDATTAATASKVVARDGNADIFCRLVRSNYGNQSTISGAMAFRVNNSGDEYIRFCSDTAAIRTFLGVSASSHTHSYVPLAGGDMTGNLKFTGANGIIMKSGSTEAKTLWSHNNGNVTLGAVNGELYLGYTTSGYGTTTKVRLEKDMYTNAGATRVIDTSGKLYYQGNDIDSRYDRNTITTITKSLTLTTNWIDTGIAGTNLSTGTYAVQMLINDGTNTSQYSEHYSGMMSWYSAATNSADADEILLHKAGHASSGRHAYLRTLRVASSGSLKLQIAFTHTCTVATSITFKFKKLI